MKGLILPLAVVPGLIMSIQAHGCGVMPEHFFLNIMNHPNQTDEAKQSANWTLQYTRQITSRSSSWQGTEGISQDGDDDGFPEEDSPGDAQTLQDEEDAFERLDAGPADPDSVEDPDSEEDPPSSSRRGLSRRQYSTLTRFIHNDNMGCNQARPGTLVRNEVSGRALDLSVNQVFDNFYWADRLFRLVYGRNSIDNRGESFKGRIHHCRNLNNAMWDGRSMFFGDGDGILNYKNSYAASQDVAGHELTHGVIQRTNPLNYYGMTGALNEHLADVFGVLSRQLRQNVPAVNDNWVIGANIQTNGGPIRSMRAPGTAYYGDQQTANMANYYNGPTDNAGVHINSGIPNRAFYIFATSVGGYAWNSPAGKIWYNVLNRGQGPFNRYGETFQSFAQRTINAAGQLYSQDVAAKLYSAWRQVGVLS